MLKFKKRKIIIVLIIPVMILLGIKITYISTHIQSVDVKKSQDSSNNLNQPKDEQQIIVSSKDIELEKIINEELGDYKNNVGLFYLDLTTGQAVCINEDRVFIAASTIKVPMNMVLFDKIFHGEIDINESIQYSDSDYEEGTGILQNATIPASIPIKVLSEDSIKYSDNIATNMLIDRIEYYDMKRIFAEELGHDEDDSANYITPTDAVKFLIKLYNNKDNNPYYPDLIETMKDTIFHDRIDRYIPESIAAHKIGDYADFVNDIGIIYTKKPYILAVYTEGMVGEANEVISHVSKVIYDYQLEK